MKNGNFEQQVLEIYAINPTMSFKDISGYSREDFTTLVLPYICDSMKYKLWLK